jgi:hypothetical protein
MATSGKKDESDIKALIAHEIRSATSYDDSELSDKRAQALEYYQGEMRDVPPLANRSKVVSRTVSDAIDRMLPGILKIFTGGDRWVEYEPQTQQDEEIADQASDYVTYLFRRKNDGYRIFHDSVFDTLTQSYAIIKHWWDDYEDYKEEKYHGLSEQEIGLLLQDGDVEILGQEAKEEVLAGVPTLLYDIKVRRIKSRGKVCVEVIPPEDFLIDKEAMTIEEARFCAQRTQKTRSDLIEMGFKREDVDKLTRWRSHDFTEESLAREGDRVRVDDIHDESQAYVEFYECYAKVDVNGDGVGEMIRAYYAGHGGSGELLDWEEFDGDYPFTDIQGLPFPHRFDGQSIAEKLIDVQRITTVLTRQATDNIYAHNVPQPIVVENSVINKDALINPKFGQPIWVRKGMDKPLEWRDTPFVADKTLMMLEFYDNIIERRTGISKASMQLDPESLQNQTATASQIMKDSSAAMIEHMARNMAEGYRKMFRAILKLVCQYQEKAEVIRLRGKWVTMDPRSWNSDMDCEVNVGLGTGSRDRDMAALSLVANEQKQLMAAYAQYGYMPGAIQMLPKLVKTLVKQAEAAGLKNANDLFPELAPEELQGMMQQAMQPQQDPKAAAEGAKIQLEQQKLQADMQAKQADMQMEGQKVQMDAAMQERQMQFEMEKLAFEREKMNADFTLKAQLEREKMAAKIEQERAQMEADLIVKRQEMELEAQLEREKMQMQMQMQARQMQSQSAPKYSKVVRNKDGKVEAVETVTQ